MASQGPLYGSLDADSGSPFGSWASTSNVFADDAAYASATFNGASPPPSSRLLVTGFSFSTSGTIDGVVVEIERYTSSGSWNEADYEVQLIKGGTVQGTNKANTPAGNWPTSPTVGTYGGISDTWGLTLTPTDVNNYGGFGVAISVAGDSPGKSSYTMRIDYIRVTVYYTAATALFIQQPKRFWPVHRASSW